MSKNKKKKIKLVNIKGETLHIFWMTWGNSMTFLGKMWLMIILKVTKKLGFSLSVKYLFGKTKPPPFFGLISEWMSIKFLLWKPDVLKLHFFQVKKIVSRSVFGNLQLTQILLNFKTPCYNLKITGLGKRPCEVFSVSFVFSEISL